LPRRTFEASEDSFGEDCFLGIFRFLVYGFREYIYKGNQGRSRVSGPASWRAGTSWLSLPRAALARLLRRLATWGCSFPREGRSQAQTQG
jgi:hypothetical protein